MLRTALTSKKNASLLASVLLLAVITGCKQSEPTEPITKNLYPPTADAKADIAAAITQAGNQHKNIILAFGGDWCAQCLVLDYYLHQPPNAQILSNNYILVHVDIGQMDHNVDIANKYQVPIKKGVPALAVLNSTGTLLFAQQNKEFEVLSAANIQSVTEFLNRWKS
jgi:thiol:disulfide interchange protein